jgi:hypothetical protein
MFKYFILVTTLLLICLPKLNHATIVTSNGTGGGDWSNSISWSPATVPGCFDTISILAGDIISIDGHVDLEACPPVTILIYGTILFPDNGWKMKLPCDSEIFGFGGGSISAPGEDASNKISICGEWVFESNEADLSGPFELLIAPLPVEIMSFDAEIDNTSVRLFWKTATELNNDYFTLERSENGTNFEEYAQIPGFGNSNTIKEYEFFDDAPIMGTSYYRLKQTDFDGKFEYLKLVAVNFNQDEDGICTLQVYPNPCVGSCTINLKDCPLSDSQVDVKLYDAFGKKISNRISPKNKDQDISFHLNSSNNLAPGVYIVRASTNGKNQSNKVIVK